MIPVKPSDNIKWKEGKGTVPKEYYEHYESSPAVVGDRVYVCDSQILYCLTLQKGELLYKMPAYSPCSVTPTIMDERIYLAVREDLFQYLFQYQKI